MIINKLINVLINFYLFKLKFTSIFEFKIIIKNLINLLKFYLKSKFISKKNI